MPPLVRRDIKFDSADGHSRVVGYIYTNPQVKPFCVLQISHGMCEHMARYEEFAGYLAEKGVAVCGNDHIGHGTSAQDTSDLGYFGENGGRAYAVTDLRTMNSKIRALFPDVPVILLGHSMGSFFARKYAVRWPATIDGLILSGTGGHNSLAPFGIAMARLVAKLKGPRHRSELVHRLAFGKYLKKIEDPNTNYDWISRDEEIVQTYNQDPFCTFRFTVNGFHELFSALHDVSSQKWANGVRKNMPVMIFSGNADPVGDYGKGVMQVREWLRHAGVRNLTFKLYPGGRHEMLNETNRKEVFADVWAFINRNWGAGAPN